MTSTSTTATSAASGTSKSRTGRGIRTRRPQLTRAQPEAADAAGAAKIAALHDQISERVEQLTADPQWRAMLDAAAKSAIAKEACVAVQTLYLSLGSKTAILQAPFDTALKGDDDPDGILETDWFQRTLIEPDGRSALRLFCVEARHVIPRGAPLFDAMRAAAADPEVRAHNQRLRANGYHMIAEALGGRDGFAPDLAVADAMVIMYAVVSEDSFLLMVTEHGWTQERWLDWATETCLAQLFPGHRAGRTT